MVFQNYALYPYMNVFENIAFGLRARKTPQAGDRDARCSAPPRCSASTSCSTGFRASFPAASASASRSAAPSCAMPGCSCSTSRSRNLDAQLRDEMRSEIKRLHQELGTTMIYVTHDQIEAMTLADRIVLLRDGKIEQAGTPLDLYERPATHFVAGLPRLAADELHPRAAARSRGGGWAVQARRRHQPAAAARRATALAEGRAVVLGLRPQHMTRATGSDRPRPPARSASTVELVQPTGSRTYITFPLGGVPIVAELRGARRAASRASRSIWMST